MRKEEEDLDNNMNCEREIKIMQVLRERLEASRNPQTENYEDN